MNAQRPITSAELDLLHYTRSNAVGFSTRHLANLVNTLNEGEARLHEPDISRAFIAARRDFEAFMVGLERSLIGDVRYEQGDAAFSAEMAALTRLATNRAKARQRHTLLDAGVCSPAGA